MTIQEAFEDIIKWRNSIPSPKTSFKKENTKKHTKKRWKTCQRTTWVHHGYAAMCPLCAY